MQKKYDNYNKLYICEKFNNYKNIISQVYVILIIRLLNLKK